MTLTDSPAAAAWGGRVHVFARGSDGTLYCKPGDGRSWGPWQSLGGVVVSSPAAAATSARLCVFVRSSDDKVWEKSHDGLAWCEWTLVGGQVSDSPAAAADGNRVELVVRGADNRLWHNRQAASGWEQWRAMGGDADSAPAAAFVRPGHLVAFCRGRNRGLWHSAFDAGVDRWESLGGLAESAPAAVGGAGLLELFVRSKHGHVCGKTFDGAAWSRWVDVGGAASSAPAVTLCGSDLHLFVLGPGQRVYHRARCDGAWGGWSDLGRPRHESPIRAISHNIPARLPPGSRLLAGVRLRNESWLPARFRAVHTAFWDQSSEQAADTVEVHVDGALLLHAQVPGQQITGLATSTIFFELPPLAVGEHRLELRTAPPGSPPRRIPLLAFGFRVAHSRLPWRVLLARAWVCLHGQLPIWKLRARWQQLEREMLQASPEERTVLQKAWKGVNRELASAEKQIRCSTPWSLPSNLSMDTTWLCNLSCPRCFREFLPSNPNAIPDMPRAQVEQMIAELFPVAETVNLSSVGEPLLSPHLETILKACRRHQVALSLTTNGTVLGRPGLLEKLVPLLHRIEVSIDSLRPDVFAWLREGTSLEAVLRNLRRLGRLRRERPEPRFGLGVSMTLFRENVAEVPEMLKLVAEIGGSFLKAEVGVILGKRDVESSVLRCPDLYEQVYEQAQQQAAALGLSLMMRRLGPGHAATGPASHQAPAPDVPLRYGICDYLYLHANITSEGQVKPCFTPPLPSGDPSLAGSTFRDRWRSQGMRRLRRDHDSPRGPANCQRCYVIQNGSNHTANADACFLRGEAVRRIAVTDRLARGTGPREG